MHRIALEDKRLFFHTIFILVLYNSPAIFSYELLYENSGFLFLQFLENTFAVLMLVADGMILIKDLNSLREQ
jgi:hypothetical protein